jgi:tetrahydromethanopterin S-methyltransferase subunit F
MWSGHTRTARLSAGTVFAALATSRARNVLRERRRRRYELMSDLTTTEIAGLLAVAVLLVVALALLLR